MKLGVRILWVKSKVKFVDGLCSPTFEGGGGVSNLRANKIFLNS